MRLKWGRVLCRPAPKRMRQTDRRTDVSRLIATLLYALYCRSRGILKQVSKFFITVSNKQFNDQTNSWELKTGVFLADVAMIIVAVSELESVVGVTDTFRSHTCRTGFSWCPVSVRRLTTVWPFGNSRLVQSDPDVFVCSVLTWQCEQLLMPCSFMCNCCMQLLRNFCRGRGG